MCDNAFRRCERMIERMDKYTIITLKKKGESFRSISKILGIDRKTVSKIWNTYIAAEATLISSADKDILEENQITETIIGSIKYDSSNRKKTKLTESVKKRIVELIEFENEKTKRLGRSHKQKLSGTQIHEILQNEGHDIGVTTVRGFIKSYKQSRETFIRQEYAFGQRLEYDFGEIKLWINGKKQTYFLAVFTAPASGFKYAYLYKNQKQEVFMDSHVRFFEMVGGSYKEVVYDNMKNVVKAFLPNGEKILNDKCVQLALYYGYEINTTNIAKGNEKGSVENGVKVTRNQIFTKNYEFMSFEQACHHLEKELEILNIKSLIEKEKEYLTPYRLPFELAEVELARVNKYGCIRVENNFYSVPDYLMTYTLTIKKYHDKILVYSNGSYVCEHKKIDGSDKYQLVMSHYLKTFATKPGALKNSLVLKQQPQLYDIYHTHFKARTKEFIALLQKHSNRSLCELMELLKYNGTQRQSITSKAKDSIEDMSRIQLKSINQLMN